MKMRNIILITLVIASAILIVAAANDQAPKGRSDFELPKLFSFSYYKQLFGKHYGTISEEFNRRRIFLAKAYRAFISGVSYKFKLSKYYLAVNDFSDRTPTEIESMQSKLVVLDNNKRAKLNGSLDSIIENPPLMSPESLEQKLDEIKSRSDQPGYSIIAKEVDNLQDKKQRRKRNIESRARQDFSMDQLIKDNIPSTKVSPDIEAKIVKHPISNNPDYEPPEVTSQGIADYLPTLATVTDSISKLMGVQETDDKAEERLAEDLVEDEVISETMIPDRLFVDHRKSKCMFEPEHQGDCGSCYAFAATTYFEWAICKETGKLMRLSEQYMIDCGRHLPNEVLLGCNGGYIENTGDFFDKYGFELETNYPYVGADGTCPYANSRSAGFYRGSNPGRHFVVPIESFEEYLKNGPIIITVGILGDFLDYGGGVHNGFRCCNRSKFGGHAMLLVGHGRENGEEYWLIRNSHGPNWGENGYYKLSKNSECIQPRNGYMYATTDGIDIKVFLEENDDRPLNVDEKIRDTSRYEDSS